MVSNRVSTRHSATKTTRTTPPPGAGATDPNGDADTQPCGDGAAVSDQQRHRYVEVAAYYIAERRGFSGGSELEDWAEAELQIERMLKEDLPAH